MHKRIPTFPATVSFTFSFVSPQPNRNYIKKSFIYIYTYIHIYISLTFHKAKPMQTTKRNQIFLSLSITFSSTKHIQLTKRKSSFFTLSHFLTNHIETNHHIHRPKTQTLAQITTTTTQKVEEEEEIISIQLWTTNPWIDNLYVACLPGESNHKFQQINVFLAIQSKISDLYLEFSTQFWHNIHYGYFLGLNREKWRERERMCELRLLGKLYLGHTWV